MSSTSMDWDLANAPFEMRHALDDKGRVKFPAFLLTAHKPG